MEQDSSATPARAVKSSVVVEAARRICGERGLRLTDLRLVTLEEVAGNGPVSAYRLMALLRRRLARAVHPPTVYRALDFLIGAGLVAKLESRSAYMIRNRPGRTQLAVLLLCDRCDRAVEYEDADVLRQLAGDAAALGFHLRTPIIECSGTCQRCAANMEASL